MNASDSILLWRFAAACAGSVLFAGVIFLLVRVACGRWKALPAQRSVWAMAQAAVAAVFLFALLPSEDLKVFPAVELPSAQEAHAFDKESVLPGLTRAEQAEPEANNTPDGDPGHASLASTAGQMLGWLPVAWLFVYVGGLGWLLQRKVRSNLHWNKLRLASRRVHPDELRILAFSERQVKEMAKARLVVLETEAPVSPLLVGIRRPCLLLPTHLRSFSTEQQQMIIEHELTHWRRKDTVWLAASNALETLFWFNLPFRWLAQGQHHAVELGCDDTVLANRTQRERQTYAAALVGQLKFQHIHSSAAPAFGMLGVTDRIKRMRDQRHSRFGSGGRVATVAACAGLVLAGASLQPAFSSVPPSLAGEAPAVAPQSATAPLQPWRYPLDRVRVTSLYGVASELLPKGHGGIDFAAKRGTPVYAVAAGKVAETGADERYGNYVRINHGAGRESRVIHLDRIAVERGADLHAGQLIGTAGSTGFATGPHLHLDYLQDGQRRDPQQMFADLDTHATAKALARRKAQSTQPTQE